MPQMELNEYKFPDEQDVDPDIAAQNKSGDEDPDKLIIEVEDDTPPEDRNRDPMPKDIVEDLEKDELDEYEGAAKDKLRKLKKVWHDERREKERALREQQEAVVLAQRLLNENKRIREMLDTGGKEYASTLQSAANLEVEAAKRALKEAHESGDADRFIDAQQALTTANFKLQQAQNFKMPSLQEENFEVKSVQGQDDSPKPADPKLNAWLERNRWYGSPRHRGMTAYALGVHTELVEDGVTAGSDEYYTTLDKTIRGRFPEHFAQTEDTGNDEVSKAKAEPARSKPSTVVAPAVRSTSSNKVKLRLSQIQLAKRLGLTPEQYAIELRKLESKNG